MNLFCKKDYFSGEFIFVFVGYGKELENVVIELIYNWGIDKYDLGNGFGYIVLGVEDIYSICDKIRDKGGKVVWELGLMKYGIIVIVFVEDFDGYKIELI